MMRKQFYSLVVIAFYSVSAFGNIDTNQSELNDQKIDSIEVIVKALHKENLKLKSQIQYTKSSLHDSISRSNEKIEAILKTLDENNLKIVQVSSEIENTKSQVSEYESETDSEISQLDEALGTKSLLAYVLVLIVLVVSIGLFFFIRSRSKSDTTALEDLLVESRKNLQEEQMNLDKKLVEILEMQLNSKSEKEQKTESPPKEEDHSLALKIADEIIRMNRNISMMDKETRGLKQLSKALERMQDTFKSKGYELVDLLNKKYDEGMNVSPTFINSEEIEPGEQLITRIIKPQVNYDGKMIQAAQVEVSINE